MFSKSKVTNLVRLILCDLDGMANKTKVMKLLYLMERKMLELYNDFIINDRFVALPHGPALDRTFYLIKDGDYPLWEEHIDKKDKIISLKKLNRNRALERILRMKS